MRKKTGRLFAFPLEKFLFFNNCLDWAGMIANAAFNAFILVDDSFAVYYFYCVAGAFFFTVAASDASFCNFKSHINHLSKKFQKSRKAKIAFLLFG